MRNVQLKNAALNAVAAAESVFAPRRIPTDEISHGCYTVRFARTAGEVDAALELQFQVFNLELRNNFLSPVLTGIERDAAPPPPANCLYLIVVEKPTGAVVGTYRIASLEMTGEAGASGFFSADEFHLEDLPARFLARSIEISRLCIAREHRNKQVLFLLWKGLANYLTKTRKRYFFGCCSIFSQNYSEAVKARRWLREEGHFHSTFSVRTRREFEFKPSEIAAFDESIALEMPKLFGTYLRMGAKVCSPQPAIDRKFRTIDFFMLFDLEAMSDNYRRLFFD